MKKFLVFLVAIITTICIGVTFYQFAKNDEVIKVNAQTIYVNYGDKLSLDDIGFSRKEASKETKIDFNAGGEEVTSIIKYDELSGCYIPTSKGGSTTIKISTTNRKYKSFSIDVVVGIGTEEFPYYISNEEQLFDVTNANIDKGACFKVVNDITLTQPHTPIGLINNFYYEFNGKFDGGYYTISNLTVNSCDYAGLFAIIGANSQICNLNIENSVIDGSFINVGSIAGICYGSINKVVVSNSTITNTMSSSNTGAVVGLLASDALYNTTASMLRTYAYTNQNKLITGNGILGGLAGKMESAIMHACHTQLCLKNTSTGATGGLVGHLIVDENTYVRESYTVAQFDTSGTCGNVVGSITLHKNVKLSDITKELVLVGLYYDNSLNNFGGVGGDPINFANATTFAVNGKSTTEMKNKDTYVYYVNNSNTVVYWDNVWYLVNGEYPTLVFANNFDDVVLEGDKLPTTPEDNPTTPDISNPETPNTSVILISSKVQLISTFQTSKPVKGDYILTTDINLGGMEWIPVSFTGTFKSSDKHNYTISNFNINGSNLLYAGFFYDLKSAEIRNITFSNVNINSQTTLEASGIVVGHIRGNVVISNVDVVKANSSASSKYFGGIAGYVNNIITKIELSEIQNLTITGNCLNVGGVAGYTSNNSYIISCKAKNSITLTGVDRIGGVVAVNHGTIDNCSFTGNIKSISKSNAGYFGGLVGVNYSTVSNSSTFAEISVINTSNTQYYVGGLCGYNIGTLSNCCIYADEFNAKQSTGIVYLAGLTAHNTGTLEYCVADVLNIGSVDTVIYTAGLSAFNYGGKIFGCFHFGNLNGYQVAGLVRINTNNGTIDSCMSGLNDKERATYKGIQVTSLVYEISSGTISNCVVNANLNGTSNKGWVAGFAGFMPLTNKKFGTISHCIANVSINGIGQKYLDITDDGLMKKKRTTGTITNCVISKDAKVNGVIISEYSKILWITQEPASKSNYIVANSTELSDLDTYLDPTTCNFDISVGISSSKWLYVNNRIPLPRPFLEVFGYDIIGL